MGFSIWRSFGQGCVVGISVSSTGEGGEITLFAASRSAVELGYILRHVPGYEFSMSTFEARLRFQKTVYLLQAFGINRGYDFSWYLRGPYCSLAAHDGYGLRGVYDLIPDGGPPFKSARANEAFKKFCHFIYGKEIDELEIAASLHYLKHAEQWDDERVKKAVEDKQDRFTRNMVDREWDNMEANGLV